jgi:hypothetical protein
LKTQEKTISKLGCRGIQENPSFQLAVTLMHLIKSTITKKNCKNLLLNSKQQISNLDLKMLSM